MAWPYTPLTTYVGGSTPSIKAADLNAIQAQVNVLSNWKDNSRYAWYVPKDWLIGSNWTLSSTGGILTSSTAPGGTAVVWLNRFFAKSSTVRERITKVEVGMNVAIGNSGGNAPKFELFSYDNMTTAAPTANLADSITLTATVNTFVFYTLFNSPPYGNKDTSALFVKVTSGLAATGDIIYGLRVTYDETLY